MTLTAGDRKLRDKALRDYKRARTTTARTAAWARYISYGGNPRALRG